MATTQRVLPGGSPIDRLVGANLAQARAAVGIPHDRLSRLIDVSAEDLRAIEQGAARPDPVLLADLARLLNVSVRSIFSSDMPAEGTGTRRRRGRSPQGRSLAA